MGTEFLLPVVVATPNLGIKGLIRSGTGKNNGETGWDMPVARLGTPDL